MGFNSGFKGLNRGSTTGGPQGCVMRFTATYINYVYTIKVTQ
jgi:hypothetical protein